MWIGLFSDIHANREALEASFDHARRAGIGRFIFLGDYVGYGADPGFAVDTVMREVEGGAVALLGNHDAAIASGTARMNYIAAEAIEWTRPKLNATQREFLAQLPLTFEEGNRLFVHASAYAPERWDYITALKRLAQLPGDARRRRHSAATCTCRSSIIDRQPESSRVPARAGGEIPLLAHRRWLAVIGSVGQPRDHNPAACYGALDTERNVLIYVRVPYDNETAARKVREAGLPQILSHRLIEGA